ncbi:MAG: ATP-binding cassette domain-containing protein [Chloroflexia bacterium]|nr:ATP-binding cassette domain-containing protein [Chloroflexia bacterium]
MTEPIISARGLTKTFWRRSQRKGMLGAMRGLVDRGGTEVTAVDDVSFDIPAGEIVGYIGPNGAGKSTTIKMLTGILVPSSGEVSVAGHTPWEERRQLAQKIGVVFGQRTQLWWDLPLSESLELLRFMYKVPERRFKHNLAEATDLLDLAPFLETPVRQLSLGQRMRGDLAAALLHEPPILYLDEPTIGLDLVAKTRIREFLAELNRSSGVTILLTTHDLADIERLCKRIVVIDHGRIVHDGELERLKARFSSKRQLTLDFDVVPDLASAVLPTGTALFDQEGPRVRIAFDRHERSAPEVLSLMGRFGTIRDMSIDEPAIEDVIQELYAESARATA